MLFRSGISVASILLFGAVAMACLVLAFTGNIIPSISAIILIRLAYSLFQPFEMTLQNKQIHTSNRATALSINAMIIDSVGAGTNLLFGALAEINLKATFLFGMLVSLVGLS